tara:strand:- start:9027 stop:9689 length:663 start_codon:yes stop_codon:yes gene_type:complete
MSIKLKESALEINTLYPSLTKDQGSDLMFLCRIVTDFKPLIELCNQKINTDEHKNYFISHHESDDPHYNKRTQEFIDNGYVHGTNEFYQVFCHQFSDIFEKFKKASGLINAVSSFLIQPAGNVIGWHQDTFVTFRKKHKESELLIYRYMMMVEDSQPGHYFSAGNQTISSWKQGDIFYWEPNMFHCGANAGIQRKITLNITGFAGENCLHNTSLGKTIII